ncbi:MAG TPA: DNA polymerase/3'-5' exonuclease PolX [Candidatus Binatia bacterium]|nr:DNA polymerase/3'-5' exonuclease PolX [Candidatus Binatia bacterium]
MPRRPPTATADVPSPAAEEPPLLSNAEIARILHEIGDILEVKGEVVYKTVAYHRAADEIARHPVEVARAYREGRPPTIPGVGKAIAEKLEELARTGRLAYYERLREEFPASLLALLEIPGVGPKTVKLLYEQLGIDSIEDLRRAAEAGRLRSLRGFSAKAEQSILAGIAALERRPGRMLLDRAAAHVAAIEGALAGTPGLRRLVAAGSYRRRVETIGDLDLLAETDEPEAVVERLTTLPEVERVLGRGSHKASVVLRGGPQVDCMIMPPGAAGTYLVHFTGSKAHNVRLRARARDRGWSLSEHGFLRLGPDGEPLAGAEAELRTFATEAEVYGFLELPYIEPELREDRGEIEAALAGRLPRLVERSDLRGDLHCHSDWSDGVHDIATMAEAARRAGLEYIVLTDHTVSLAIARGLDPARFATQRAVVAELNARYEAEEREGRIPPGGSPAGFRILHGCELEIRADGSLDLPEEVLAGFDLVVASLHVGRRQPRERLTARVLAAIRNPHVDVIAHPAGRIIGERDDLDLDWDAVFEVAAETGTALELNGSPHRLDLSAERARQAVAAGCLLAIDSDAHRTTEFSHLDWGVSQARRGWVEARAVVNARSRAELLAWAAGKAARVG